MGDIFLNDTSVSDKAKRTSAEDNNPEAEDRQEHTEIISGIKATKREDMK